MSATLTAADFDPESSAPWRFRISSDASVELRVIETKVKGDPRPFSVLFAGPLQPELTQATFAASHPAQGDVDLFIVPVARTADAMHYEAVFA